MRAILFSGGLALVFTLLGTRVAIRILVDKGYGQLIRDDGPTTHHTKRGTPTMGGTVVILSVVAAYLLSSLFTSRLPTASGLLLLFLFAGLGAVGFLDDYIKIAKQRSLGLRSRAKMTGQVLVAVVFGVLALRFPDERGQTPASRYLSFTRDWEQWALPGVLVVALILLMIAATSNAVNLTDGLDGLAAGSSTFAFSAFAIIGFWQFRHFDVYRVPQALDLAVVAVSLTGACAGFLWWNAAPARIFMGDTGSLAIGGTLGVVAICCKQELLLIVVGGVFVAEALSVLIQRVWFKYTRRRYGEGRRVFRMAPLHHHFELIGWKETTVVVRFWILSVMCALLGLATLKLR